MFKKKGRRTVGFNPTTFQGDQGAAMSPSGMTDVDMEPSAALQPEILGNPTPKMEKPRLLPTHHPTVLPKFPIIDKKMQYKKR